eukprot:136294_1
MALQSASTSPTPLLLLASASASFAAIFTPDFGVKSGTMTSFRTDLKYSSSVRPLMPYMLARKLAAATIKSASDEASAAKKSRVTSVFSPGVSSI